MGVGVRARRGVLRSTGASRLHENVVLKRRMKMFPLNDDGVHLASEGDGPQRDDEEQVGNVGLDALPMKYLTLT